MSELCWKRAEGGHGEHMRGGAEFQVAWDPLDVGVDDEGGRVVFGEAERNHDIMIMI